MKNRIVTIISIVALIFIIILMVKGIKMGKVEVYSIKEIIKQNEDIAQELTELATLTTVDYETAIQELEETNKKLVDNKEKYYDLVDVSSDKELVYESEEYDIAYLWTIIGRYATDDELELIMNVVKSGVYYDLKFTLKGEYDNIKTFVSEIENDSELQFRIHDFKMIPGVKLQRGRELEDTMKLEASFAVKDISLNEETLSTANVSTNNLTAIEDITDTNESLDNTTSEEQNTVE